MNVDYRGVGGVDANVKNWIDTILNKLEWQNPASLGEQSTAMEQPTYLKSTDTGLYSEPRRAVQSDEESITEKESTGTGRAQECYHQLVA